MKRIQPPLSRIVAIVLLLGSTSACAQHSPTTTISSTPILMAAVSTDDAVVVTAFRALLDEVIGDSAEKVCLSVARPAASGETLDADPSASVMRALRGGPPRVLPRSVCAADERNFGNPRGLIRLRDVSAVDEHTLIVHAEAIGDHSARYECVVPRADRRSQRPRCRITARDWPGSQGRS